MPETWVDDRALLILKYLKQKTRDEQKTQASYSDGLWEQVGQKIPAEELKKFKEELQNVEPT